MALRAIYFQAILLRDPVDITETESQIYLLILISEKRQDEEREDPTIDDVNLLSSAGIRVGK